MGAATRFRRLVGRAIAADLTAFVVPGPEIARAHGLDLGAAGLRIVPTPRHATVLVIVDALPERLARAAAVAYAQMPRPRAILALGVATVPPLPAPDVDAALEQSALLSAVTDLRRLIADTAFSAATVSFEVAALRTTTAYTCPMHPEIVRAAPGSCPICGMDLVPREDVGEDLAQMAHDARAIPTDPAQGAAERGTASTYTCPMHPEIVRDAPGACPICGMDLVPREDGGENVDHGAPDMAHGSMTPVPDTEQGREGGTAPTYTCPMHPEIVRDQPGKCPLCGMDLVPREDGGAGLDHDAPTMADDAAHGTVADPPRDGYTCPMHPEIVQGAPGACPLCGMALVPREGTNAANGHGTMAMGQGQADGGGKPAYTCPMHPEIVRNTPGKCPLCGMDLVPTADMDGDDAAMGSMPTAHRQHEAAMIGASHDDHGAVAGLDRGAINPPPHPGPGGGEPGSAAGARNAPGTEPDDHRAPGSPSPASPGAGDERATAMDHSMHDMGEMDGMDGMDGMDHSAHMQGGFMSMVAMTRDLPRSRDGLPMEWADAPFGPLFPGLPGGLDLALTLDGDVVARAALTPGAAARNLAATWPGPAVALPDRLTKLDPLSPFAYHVLALRALEAAAGTIVDDATARARIRGLERERVASHLGWLASFGALLGVGWLAARAAALQLALLAPSGPPHPGRLDTAIRRLVGGVERTPLLARRLAGRGRLPGMDVGAWRGPVARASGRASDARMADPAYRALGFVPVTREGADALARLRVRLAEVTQSLDLIAAAAAPPAAAVAARSADLPAGHDPATVETPRGAATLQLTLEGDVVRAIRLETPCAAHADLVAAAAEGHELADALVGIASLDLSPWAVDR